MNTTFALIASVWFTGAGTDEIPGEYVFPVASCTKADAHIILEEAQETLGWNIEDIVIQRCVQITTIDVEGVRGY